MNETARTMMEVANAQARDAGKREPFTLDHSTQVAVVKARLEHAQAACFGPAAFLSDYIRDALDACERYLEADRN